MKIITTRRISQIFFFGLFVWFCIVSSLGENINQLRGWPINMFLHMDPLVSVATILTTHTLYAPLILSLAVVILTIIFGRFFCGWVCPFGAIHQFVSHIAHNRKPAAKQIKLNDYSKGQNTKYYILILFLTMAAIPMAGASLQTGLLDPIPLVTRSFNLLLIPVIDRPFNFSSLMDRFYDGAWFVLLVFALLVMMNLYKPRFFCRYICPLGALFAILGRFSIWRIGKNNQQKCTNCKLCDKNCQGGCEPADKIKISECLLCFNCRDNCKDGLISYQTTASKAGEIRNPDINRRGFMFSIAGSLFAVPAIRLSNEIGSNWSASIIRPPGALSEEEFLKRCIKCGQCMRVCPTNVLQPASIKPGIENLWTPILNNRIGSSGCQYNCVACGQVCPTAAIRPITLDEKHGKGEFEKAGPIKMGTAFVDRGRCLPWSMNKPCIVCQENCPVSPKAIHTFDYFKTVRDGKFTVKNTTETMIETIESSMAEDKFSSGDYYCTIGEEKPRKIVSNSKNKLEIDPADKFTNIPAKDSVFEIQIRLQGPEVDIEKCIGCGICEHECPVSGLKAIRVTAEGETRSNDRGLLL